MADYKHPLRVGVGGPVGSGKTALLEALCKAMRDTYHLAVVTNDIYTKEERGTPFVCFQERQLFWQTMFF